MHQSSAQLFKKYLCEKDISPREFSQLSGMPKTEVQGILKGDLPITSLRAHHLAAAFDTDAALWLNRDRKNKEKKINRRPKRASLAGCE
jgi:plasmid maintenance system antidote protein VapI